MAQSTTDFHTDQLAPHSVEAEEAVLGSVLLNPEALYEVIAFLRVEDFFIVRHAWIWEAILSLHERRDPIDYLTVVNELETQGRLADTGGAAYVLSLVNKTPSALNAEGYGRIVERMAIRRRLLDAASNIARIAHSEETDIDEVVGRAEQAIFDVTERRLTRDLVPVGDVVSTYFDHVSLLARHQEDVMGVPTGFVDLDRLLGGLQKSDLIIIAARPGMGKTSWLNTVVMNSARNRQRVALFSLEMSNEQLVQRFVSQDTHIPSHKLREGKLDERDWAQFVAATQGIAELPIYLDDTPALSTQELRTKARRLYLEFGLDLVVIDYLQLMTTPYRSENRVQEISYISRSLKQLARELNVPVIAAAQLSRAVEQRTDKRPMLSDLRESGCLTGDTRVYLPEIGQHVPIRELVGQKDFLASSVNLETWKLETARVSRAFCTGVKPVYRLTTRLGRTIRATANHKFLTVAGWKRLDELTIDEQVAVPARKAATPFRPSGTFPLSGGRVTAPPLPATEGRAWERGLGGEGLIAESITSDVYWDRIVSIEADGESDVYDLTVPGLHNFVADNVIVHNSIEQDSDIVMFIYRDSYYNPDSPDGNKAEIIVSKHRNGPTDTINLVFIPEITQFRDAAHKSYDLDAL